MTQCVVDDAVWLFRRGKGILHLSLGFYRTADSDTEFRGPMQSSWQKAPQPLHTIMAFSGKSISVPIRQALLLVRQSSEQASGRFGGQARGGTGATSQNPNGLFNGRRGPSEACAPRSGWLDSFHRAAVVAAPAFSEQLIG